MAAIAASANCPNLTRVTALWKWLSRSERQQRRSRAPTSASAIQIARGGSSTAGKVATAPLCKLPPLHRCDKAAAAARAVAASASAPLDQQRRHHRGGQRGRQASTRLEANLVQVGEAAAAAAAAAAAEATAAAAVAGAAWLATATAPAGECQGTQVRACTYWTRCSSACQRCRCSCCSAALRSAADRHRRLPHPPASEWGCVASRPVTPTCASLCHCPPSA